MKQFTKIRALKESELAQCAFLLQLYKPVTNSDRAGQKHYHIIH